MRRINDGDVVRIKGVNRHLLYEVIGRERHIGGKIMLTDGLRRELAMPSEIVVVVQKAARLDLRINEEDAE